ncbi:hypothetical protein HUU39_11595 [candidate division KSB1 bacterium]|nr:phage tail family protein [bacterium]NUM65901.1 hypothetical protein [candidate division KSB1 bacterium]
MGRTVSIISRFPDFVDSQEFDNVLHRFIDVFGKTLDQAESDLIKVMRSHWVDSADNEDSQGFDTAQKGDLDKIFSLYLENLGGTSQLKQVGRRPGADGFIDDAIYRERIKGLINVLKSGASTKGGLITIVAANLGIVGDDEQAKEARKQIRIVEFLPEAEIKSFDGMALLAEFKVENTNPVPTTPEIRLRLNDVPLPLTNPRVTNLTTKKSVEYNGTVNRKDVLTFFPDGTAYLNGVKIDETSIERSTPVLPPGESRFRIEALIGQPQAKFDRTLFDFSLFEREQLSLPTPEQAATFAIDTTVTLMKLSPASFMVRVPWDIPGFTEKFDQLADNPRNQIKYIVDKVKAAGVFAVIAYDKTFSEIHKMADSFKGHAQRQTLPEDHTIEEANFDIGSVQMPYPGGLEHGLSDALVTSGVFDFTRFDSLNSFA